MSNSEKPLRLTICDSILSEMMAKPLFSQLIINSIEYQPRLSGISEIFRSTNNDSLIYCLCGEGYSIINARRHRFSNNSFIIIPHGVSMQIGSESQLSFYRVTFSGKQAGNILSELPDEVGTPYSIANSHDNIITQFNTILSLLQREISIPTVSFASLLLWSLLGNIIFRDISITPTSSDDPVRDNIIFMQANLNRELSLEELAAHAGYSPSHFSTIFKEATGEAPITYFINLKMRLATEYLNKTSKSVKEISYLLGYSSQYYFSRLFKTHIGLSPTDYRRSSRSTEY